MQFTKRYNDNKFFTDYSEILLTTISGFVLGRIPFDLVESIKRNIDTPYELTLKIPKYIYNRFNHKLIEYPNYIHFKNERRIILANQEVYIIKSVTKSEDDTLTVLAKSSEVRLMNIDIYLEDCFIALDYNDETDKDIKVKNIKTMLEEQTGWTLNYDALIGDNSTPLHTERFVENIDKKWYDFLYSDMADMYNCIFEFDTVKKIIYMYPQIVATLDNPLCYLSKDSYILTLEEELDSSDLITVLRVEGNEEMDISASVCTGGDFIEDYSYFMENYEMSIELIDALKLYYKAVKKREKIWKQYSNEKRELESKKLDLGNKFISLNARRTAHINSKEAIQDEHSNNFKDEDSQLLAKILKIITDLDAEIEKTKLEITTLETEIGNLNKSIENLVILCKKETATTLTDGRLIFTPELLKELKEYYYVDTYKNESFLTENIDDLINLARRKLYEKSRPTIKVELNIADFKDRIIVDNRRHAIIYYELGDVVVLYDNQTDKKEYFFITATTHNISSKEISITLSNKRNTREESMLIADYLTSAKNAMSTIDKKMYLLNQQKYHRINLPREFVPKYKEKPKERPEGTILD